MKEIRVKDLMIPLEEYATVHMGATLYEAILALEEAQKTYLSAAQKNTYPHRAVLVLDDNGNVVGKVSQLDVLRALEPKYKEILTSDSLSKVAMYAFGPGFLKDMLDRYDLFNQPMNYICQKAAGIKVKECMYRPTQEEYVEEDDSLNLAIHKFIVGYHQSLLVVRNGKIVGILRLVDVFQKVAQQVKACAVDP